MNQPKRSIVLLGTPVNNIDGDPIFVCIDCKSTIPFCNCKWRK